MDEQQKRYGSVSIFIEVLGDQGQKDCMTIFDELCTKRIVIIESKAYYEAYSYVLKCLQEVKSIPFSELIVEGDYSHNT